MQEMINTFPQLDIVLIILMFILSSAFHETAHAWVAYRCGDSTAKDLGRISLNPLVHICPINSILVPAMLFFFSGGRFIFGGAKPVPIVAQRMRNPDRDMALSAAAGPISNFLIVIGATVVLLLIKPVVAFVMPIHAMMVNLILINLILAFFNLLPIPPLDGSRIFRYLFPQLRELYDSMDQWGIGVLLAIIFIFPGVFSFVYNLLDLVCGVIQKIYISVPW